MKFGFKPLDEFVERTETKYDEVTSGQYGYINKIII